ncbi:MAG TPA: HAD-IIB family hydrolase [Bryobacteraceae bacterium]|nr:HAD-IIB family hydrolase [Bryobacteraceae bacterium]
MPLRSKKMIVIFTDLDGTLLDAGGSYEPALPALERVRSRHVPVVFCTSKTRSEIEVLRRQLGNEHPFIVENGGAVFIPPRYFGSPGGNRVVDGYEAIEFGDRYADLVHALNKASIESSCAVRGFHQMGAFDLAVRARLEPQAALLALRREYDEPFDVLDTGRTGALLRAIERQGKHWTRGGEFYHILGRNDKGRAASALLDLYRKQHGEVTAVGIGDGPNDAAFLGVMDLPWIVRSRFALQLVRQVPGARLASASGPDGWNEAVNSLPL